MCRALCIYYSCHTEAFMSATRPRRCCGVCEYTQERIAANGAQKQTLSHRKHNKMVCPIIFAWNFGRTREYTNRVLVYERARHGECVFVCGAIMRSCFVCKCVCVLRRMPIEWRVEREGPNRYRPINVTHPSVTASQKSRLISAGEIFDVVIYLLWLHYDICTRSQYPWRKLALMSKRSKWHLNSWKWFLFRAGV